MTTVSDILAELRAAATDNRDLGDRFERVMVAYLQTDPLYADRYSNVWRWVDWPGRGSETDTGIDLVAEERDGGGLCAIQCKCYEPNHYLAKEDIDSFFTKSGKVGFTSRMIISTTDRWSRNAEEALEGQQVPVMRLRVQDLDESPVDWSQFSVTEPTQLPRRPKKSVRPHQAAAIDDVLRGLARGDRGKLIMACGTGKTFTALKLAEQFVPLGGTVLFLVPSISLLSQSLKEWSSEAAVPLRLFAVCSDVKVGKRTKTEDIGPYDLAFPATTKAPALVEQITASSADGALTVVFATYQSIGVITDAHGLGLSAFDLVICDEAHRTTGVTIADEDESNFVRVHDDAYVQGRKRLYMTATPRIYDDASKAKAEEGSAVICSMDDESLFGPELHRLGFGQAVAADLLSDYKVLVLAVDEASVSRIFQSQLANKDHELSLDDAARIVGCWNGLSKRGMYEETFEQDPAPMRRAVAFSRSIKDSRRITALFNEIVESYATAADERDLLHCEIDHVDGTFNALVRNERLDWLKEETGAENLCRILSNARCLSEGVDVPALDAVLFLNPRNSVVDVVQSVGRVMRKSAGKRFGYVILPIGIPAGEAPEKALGNNERYKVVWQVLQALRAHDDRFNAMVNKIELNKKRDDQIQIIGVGGGDDLENATNVDARKGAATYVQGQLALANLDEWRDAIYAKIVQKVGDRRYWEDWAKDVAIIAERHVTRIRVLLEDESSPAAVQFEEFLAGLRANLNDSITENDAVDMLAQHLITRPVFDALFEDYSFAEHNPVSLVMQAMVDALHDQALEKESETLASFYESVRLRAEGIDNAEGRQRIITELYQQFFRTAFKKTSESLGVVYTPIEIVDFIIASVQSALEAEFQASLSDEGVHVLDPFTGTGTFIVRLLQSGVLAPDSLARKYASELHANEIILLAYYITAVNVEAVYHEIAGGDYVPFEGIVLTDTFQMGERRPADDVYFPDNNARARKQRETDIRVVIGNPPYSVGQSSENDDNKNLVYPFLDERIRSTYAARSTAGLKRNLYDSYVRAFRWASDRIGDRGVVCFVSNGSFIDTGSADGFRRSLAAEFSAIYCLNLRGNQRTSGEISRREGGKVFGEGSRTPVAITLLVKNPTDSGQCRLYYHDIGDYLSREEKLARVASFESITNVEWVDVTPDSKGDWINQRSGLFESFQPLGDKKDETRSAIFGEDYSLGVVTNRDAFAYNFSRDSLTENMTRTISAYNRQVAGFAALVERGELAKTMESVNSYIDTDPALISWTHNLKNDLRLGKKSSFDPAQIVSSMYRPFCKQWLYFNRQWNERVYQLPRLFPNESCTNLVISLNASDSRKSFGAIITDVVPNLALSDPGQCFPRYKYAEIASDGALFGSTGTISASVSEDAGSLFTRDESFGAYERRDALTDATLARYRARYGNEITKDDIFYYVYGILHSPEYGSRFAAELGKMIPRIPLVEDFRAFEVAGRELAKWHLGYESVDPWPLDGLPDSSTDPADLRVTKMAFGKSGGKPDPSVVIFNPSVTLRGIPEEAHQYTLNGRTALAWVMDRYQVKTDKASGIANDPNSWSEDPRYVVDLVARIVRVSVESARIVEDLPGLGF